MTEDNHGIKILLDLSRLTPKMRVAIRKVYRLYRNTSLERRDAQLIVMGYALAVGADLKYVPAR